ncbi:MAG: septum formation initiator family protein [bacterium]
MPRQQQGLLKKVFSSYLFLFVSIIIAVMVVFSYIRTYYQDYQVKQDIERLQQDARDLETKKSEIIEVLNYAKSANFVEDKARAELNMVKKGEKLVVINGSTTAFSGDRQIQSTVLQLDSISNYIKWWRLFMEGK